MKAYINSEQCLCVQLFTPFNSTPILPLSPSHLCCSVCAKSYDCCDKCSISTVPFLLKEPEDTIKFSTVVRKVTEEDEKLVQELLVEYHNRITPQKPLMVESHFISGINTSIIKEVIPHLPYINSADYVLKNITVAERRLSYEIVVIINDVFDYISMSKETFEIENLAKSFQSLEIKTGYIFSDDDFDCEEL